MQPERILAGRLRRHEGHLRAEHVLREVGDDERLRGEQRVGRAFWLEPLEVIPIRLGGDGRVRSPLPHVADRQRVLAYQSDLDEHEAACGAQGDRAARTQSRRRGQRLGPSHFRSQGRAIPPPDPKTLDLGWSYGRAPDRIAPSAACGLTAACSCSRGDGSPPSSSAKAASRRHSSSVCDQRRDWSRTAVRAMASCCWTQLLRGISICACISTRVAISFTVHCAASLAASRTTGQQRCISRKQRSRSARCSEVESADSCRWVRALTDSTHASNAWSSGVASAWTAGHD
mmetsp:Transcript_2102/g.4559  ORF Transcript_2102/g.4559 Transcript_2102/m.4559 type:complete len:288 (+) Transcript_2102:466-1329(+)